MVAIAAGKVKQYIKSPDKKIRAILVYGPDTGMVKENAASLAKTFSESQTPAGDIITIDENDISNNPDRLAVEIQMISMFGGEKIVKYRPGSRANPKSIEPFLEQKDLPSYLIVEAGDLKKSAKLRQIFEKSKNASAIPCYADDNASLANIINEELAKEDLSISSETRQYLVTLLGADRSLSRMELEKLKLYAANKKTIEIEDIDDIIGDASAINVDQITMSTLSGNLPKALVNLDKALSSGYVPTQIISSLNRHLARLMKTRSAMSKGQDVSMLVKRLQPPLHFKLHDEFKSQLNRWPEPKIIQAISLLQQTTLRSRTKANIENVFLERLLLSLSQLSKR